MRSKERNHWLRLAGLVALVLTLASIGIWLQRTGRLEREVVVGAIDRMGLWAIPTFFLLCVAGELMHLPGMLFVVVAQLVFGPVEGFVLAYLGAVFGVTIAFAVARAARGKEEGKTRQLPWGWANRFLDRLHHKPVSTVFILRSVFWISPTLNFVLGWSNVRARHYVIGSALGLVAPIAIVSFVVRHVK